MHAVDVGFLAVVLLTATAAVADAVAVPGSEYAVGAPAALESPAAACCCAGGQTATDVPAPETLDAMSARVRSIDIEVDNVFDTSIPEESAWLYRSGNRLHLLTQEDTIRSQLLFQEQEPFSMQKVQETERLLRGQDYLYDAWIVPTCYHAEDDSVDLQVRVRDVWSLSPGFAFGRKGGANHGGLSIEDENFLGRGEKLGLSYGKDVDRASLSLAYQDPQLFGSWWRGNFELADNSDGGLASVQLTRPFYSLDTRWSAGISALTGERVDTRYSLGEELDSYTVTEDRFELQGGVSQGLRHGWARRWLAGIRYEDSQFGPDPETPLAAPLPQDRKLLTPWLGISFIQDGYDTVRNLDQIARTEDVQFGRELRAELGFASAQLGSDRDAAVLALSAGTGERLAEGRSLFRRRLVLRPLGICRAARRARDRRSPLLPAPTRECRVLCHDTRGGGVLARPRPPDRARWRQRAARLSAALPGRNEQRAAHRRTAAVHGLVSVPPVPRGCGCLRRCGPDLG